MIIFKPLDSSCCWLHSWLEERDDWIKLHYDMTVPVRPPLGVIVEGPVPLKGRPLYSNEVPRKPEGNGPEAQ